MTACTCRGYDPADPCGHGDTSEGCPVHDPWRCETCGVRRGSGERLPGEMNCPACDEWLAS